MSGRSAVKFIELLIALAITALVLFAIRLKTEKPWPVILKATDRFSRYIEIATVIFLLLIFATFFFINNGFFR